MFLSLVDSLTCQVCSRSDLRQGPEATLEYVFGKDKCSCTFLGPARRRTQLVQFQLSNSRPLALYCKAGCCDLLNESAISSCRSHDILSNRGWRYVKRW